MSVDSFCCGVITLFAPPLNFWSALLLYLLAGGLGGVVNALNAVVLDPKAAPPPTKWRGFLTGMVASVSVLFLFSTLFEDLDHGFKFKQFLTFLAVGAISGFAGMRFLEKMTGVLESRMSALSNQIKQSTERNNELTTQLEGATARQNSIALRRVADTEFEKGAEGYTRALDYYTRAVHADPTDVDAVVGVAKCLYHIHKADPKSEKFTEGAAMLESLSKKMSNAQVLYHLAAFKDRQGSTPDVVIDLLRQADTLNPAMGRKAQEDKDRFERLKDNAQFKELATN